MYQEKPFYITESAQTYQFKIQNVLTIATAAQKVHPTTLIRYVLVQTSRHEPSHLKSAVVYNLQVDLALSCID